MAVSTLIKNVATAGTAEPLAAAATLAKSVVLQARETNTGFIYVGGADVDKDTKNGIRLAANQTFSLGDIESNGGDRTFNIQQLYIDATVNGEGVVVLMFNSDD
jgi:Ca2+-binding RTX toxin-like protein